MILRLVCIAVGGAAGALARYGLTGFVLRLTGGRFPWGTLAVNLLGSALMGVALAAIEAGRWSTNTRALLMTGLLGAFTTFSTFSMEGLCLLRERHWAQAGAYLLGSCLAGVAAAAGAFVLTRGLLGRGAG